MYRFFHNTHCFGAGGASTMQVPFHRHNLGEAEINSLAQTLRTTILTMGPRTEEFELEFGRYFNPVNPPGVIAVSNGTMALYLCLNAIGVRSTNEVITTPLSFMATGNAILATGATPVFVDVELDTGNLDARLIQDAITPRTKAILPVHLYGQMCDMHQVHHIAETHGLEVVEDACHCVEGIRSGIRPGDLGSAACFSFHALKTLTCGEGGAILTYNHALEEKLRLARYFGITQSMQARSSGGYSPQDTETPDLNYKLSDIMAALMIPQIAKLESRLRKREKVAETYYTALSGCVEFPVVQPAARSARNLFTILVDPARRDAIVKRLRESGVGCTVQYNPIIPNLAFFRRRFPEVGPFPNAEHIASRTIALPFFPSLTDEEVNYVITVVRESI